MKPFTLLAPALALALLAQSACGQPAAAPPPNAPPKVAGDAVLPHFVDMTAAPLTFVRIPDDPDAATIRLDTAAIDALKPEVDSVIWVLVGYEFDRKVAWHAENDLDPKFEGYFAATGAHARLVATKTTAYERSYYFAPDDEAALVTALRKIPQPDGASIGVMRSSVDALNELKPTAAEQAAAKPGAPS